MSDLEVIATLLAAGLLTCEESQMDYHPEPAQWWMPPAPERLALPFRTVTLFNSDESQAHIVNDRSNQPVEIRPGERVPGVEMLDDDIRYFRGLRSGDHLRRGFPPHPVVIEETPP